MQPEPRPVTGREDPKSLPEPLRALAEFYDAFNNRDMEKMTRNWALTDEIAMDNPLGGIKRGWEEIKAVYERLFNGPAKVYVEFYDYTVHEAGEIFYTVAGNGANSGWVRPSFRWPFGPAGSSGGLTGGGDRCIIMARLRIRRSWPDINWLLKAEGNRFMGYPAGIERMDEKKDKPGVIAPPPLIYLTALIAALPLYLVFSVHLLPGRLGPVLGIFLMSIGVFLAMWAFRVMRAAKTNVNPYQPATALVTDGPFRYSRNPLYMALTLLYCGITFLVNTPWPLLILPAVLFILRRGVIDREERYLEKKFGEAYLQYRASVRRWI